MTAADQAGQFMAPGPDLPSRIVALLTQRRLSVAVAESLTGGLLGAALTAVPGASAVFRGGITAYATDLKSALLGVSPAFLAEHGAVHPDVAAAMADGARARLGAAVGMATTGVAGPDPQDGKAPGTVHVAVSSESFRVVRSLSLAGDRDQIRRQSVEQCLSLVWITLTEEER
jgi:nicotinamide-nucleotide amidase